MDRKRLARLFYGAGQVAYPWATECPVKFDVWFELARRERGGAEKRADLILSVHEEHGVRRVLDVLRENGLFATAQPIAAGSFVAARLTLAELVRVILPMTSMASLISTSQRLQQWLPDLVGSLAEERAELFRDEAKPARSVESSEQLRWFLKLLHAVVQAARPSTTEGQAPVDLVPVSYVVARLLHDAVMPPERRRLKDTDDTLDRRREYPIIAVTMNRPATAAVTRSRATVKADAAEQLFSVDCSAIGWAVVDSGIDSYHPAFLNWTEREGAWEHDASRVVRAFDLVDARKALAQSAGTGAIDWSRALPEVEMFLHEDGDWPRGHEPQRGYKVPTDRHGTHVAGVLGGFWPDQGLKGVCPNIRLYDFRVLDHRGAGNEFAVIAALQAIRHINGEAGRLVIAGANLSLAVPHDVTADACGWTPVCIEVERLVRSGVVVVAAAGNSGFVGATQTLGADYRGISISDPGNADSVITVGSTHRSNPHRHGVSYFSGRGPTADGRPKPDLLAPGEDIDGPVPQHGIAAMHGTSQAAAHVSGAAAMLIARHRELLGRPERVKQVLCATATDLGRERSFQGHGLVDVLRAMQSI
ncbi:S8 family serine peptidase [Dactylosporangium aurantiacum]|uniref:S8 family serine peptidase n=1 Tax=Dactylosporangium aurantiacum TaxID=35754 RepID=A0A9Q9MF69_9ACTN|nr:S8 family serine peptidase [Dactylosporangium aurantiacum]MDG6101939.1 S8 family serine peptidase [Dactylosporangium aurantiacum]UWZ52270.1 S8 family serine peptidase [Dactylosporangium aurantiacum]